MEWFGHWALSLAVFLPAVGAVIVMLIPRRRNAIKGVTLLATLATFGFIVGILADFDYDHASDLQFQINNRWIDVI